MSGYHKKECKSFLSLITKEDRDDLIDKSIVNNFKKGEQIVRVRDLDTNLYLINKGQVRVTLFSNEGKEVSFVDINEGGNFGEFSAIDGRPRSANVIALADTTITIVSPENFFAVLQKYPSVSMEMLQQLTTIVRRLCDRISEYSMLDVGNRVQAELLRISKEHMDFDGIARIDNPPTQSELASRVSCTREAVSREMKRLEQSGIIVRKSKKLIIEDYRRLQGMISEGIAI